LPVSGTSVDISEIVPALLTTTASERCSSAYRFWMKDSHAGRFSCRSSAIFASATARDR
jgi:hypothetical protein